MHTINKKKIINDPIYGFINIPNEFVFDVIQHPYFQRLRRIKQLGLSDLVYPGAVHTRFSHALGAMHLMSDALQTLEYKGHPISAEEYESALLAILLHDIGHGPFSHALEYSIVENIAHEKISMLYMENLNQYFGGKLSMALQIFKDEYPKKFLHQLVSSQLDVDRLDYLSRDSFFTGVSEGIVGTQRIIKMLDVVDDKLVVEKKGIYSIENFLNSRRIMYWQVYLHKTVLVAEHLLMNILIRAKALVQSGQALFCSPSLQFFLSQNFSEDDFCKSPYALSQFALLDDYDILGATKVWAAQSEDPILKDLSQRLIDRRLLKIEFSDQPFSQHRVEKIKNASMRAFSLSEEQSRFYVFTDMTSNYLYNQSEESISIRSKSGKIQDLSAVSDQLSASKLKKLETKHFLCYPKEIKQD